MPSSLEDRLARLAAASDERSAKSYAVLVDFIEGVGQLDRRLEVGSSAPDFALPAVGGGTISLSALLQGRPLVLVFLRGAWCPYCRTQFAALAEMAEVFSAAGVGIAVVTPETGGRAGDVAGARDLPFPVLCDVGMGVALAYGCLFPVPSEHRDFLQSHGVDLAERSGTGAWFMPLATTFGIGQDGRILGVFGGADPRLRPEPSAVIDEMRAALAAARSTLPVPDQP